jgi:hypothetical protein
MKVIAPMLCKLIPRLGSNHPGEVVATAAAIERVLRGAGHDWHDLASALTTARKQEPRQEPEETTKDWRDTVAWCAAHHPKRLSEREWDFLRSLKGWRGDLSEKQKHWLDGIAARLKANT